MAHYVYLNQNNIVTEGFVGKNEDEIANLEQYYGAKRTSYNTYGGVHQLGQVPFRKNFAGIGYTYDTVRDAFIAPKPYPSWVLDETTCRWGAPVPRPATGSWQWDEATVSWVVL